MINKLSKICLLCAASTLAPGAMAQWNLDNDFSRLSFISIKATDVGEVHSFTHLSGAIALDGTVTVDISLASVETLIPIRNERMLEVLFEAAAFPTATISAGLEVEALQALSPGTLQPMTLEATLTMKDKPVPLTLQVMAARLDDETLLVTSLAPVLITAAAAGLSEGVEKLREIAGLPNISQAVPVSFVLTFRSSTK